MKMEEDRENERWRSERKRAREGDRNRARDGGTE